MSGKVPQNFDRKHPVHHPAVEQHNRAVIIFLTVCTRQRRRILASDEVHTALLKAWELAGHWHVGRYVIMPDHIHLFCSPALRDAENVTVWAAYWKRLVSQRLTGLQPLWQKDCWDTQLRQHESYGEKWEYVRDNPVRAGLVSRPEEWKFQGVIHHLPW